MRDLLIKSFCGCCTGPGGRGAGSPEQPNSKLQVEHFTGIAFFSGKRVEFYQVFGYIICMVTRKQIKKKGKKIPDYDSAWKDIIEEHFEPFLEFFFPHIHKDIDFAQSPEILSNELRRIVPSGKVGKRRADVLVKVFLKDGTQRCICVFIHVEVQGTKKPGFMERIFVY